MHTSIQDVKLNTTMRHSKVSNHTLRAIILFLSQNSFATVVPISVWSKLLVYKNPMATNKFTSFDGRQVSICVSAVADKLKFLLGDIEIICLNNAVVVEKMKAKGLNGWSEA